ncbi:MAG: flavodoxin family protein [Caldilineaceae bacterium]|nr:flavodoxin family protein [Caldilineaceae bacterium]
MKGLILDGGLHAQATTSHLRSVLEGIGNQLGWHVQSLVLREEKIAYCLGCFECWTSSPGLCRIDDEGRAVADAVIHSDLVIYLTPVTFGGYSSVLKKAIDRNIYLISPFFTKIDGEVHHQVRYEHYPMILGVGSLPQPDPGQAAIFAKLIERNAITMHAPAHAAVVVDETQEPAQVAATLQRECRRLQYGWLENGSFGKRETSVFKQSPL